MERGAIEDAYRGPTWWTLGSLRGTARPIAAWWLLAAGVAIGLALVEARLDWSGLPLTIGGVTIGFTIYPPLTVALLLAIWLGPPWGMVPAFLATFASALSVGIAPTRRGGLRAGDAARGADPLGLDGHPQHLSRPAPLVRPPAVPLGGSHRRLRVVDRRADLVGRAAPRAQPEPAPLAGVARGRPGPDRPGGRARPALRRAGHPGEPRPPLRDAAAPRVQLSRERAADAPRVAHPGGRDGPRCPADRGVARPPGGRADGERPAARGPPARGRPLRRPAGDRAARDDRRVQRVHGPPGRPRAGLRPARLPDRLLQPPRLLPAVPPGGRPRAPALRRAVAREPRHRQLQGPERRLRPRVRRRGADAAGASPAHADPRARPRLPLGRRGVLDPAPAHRAGRRGRRSRSGCGPASPRRRS